MRNHVSAPSLLLNTPVPSVPTNRTLGFLDRLELIRCELNHPTIPLFFRVKDEPPLVLLSTPTSDAASAKQHLSRSDPRSR
jgi:hypothetical protein